MQIVLYRRRVSLTSGAGQLIEMQARGLSVAGYRVQVAARHGGLKFLLATGFRIRRYGRGRLRRLGGSPDHLLVDHAAGLPEADLVFVHNLMTEGVRHVERRDWRDRAAHESAFFKALRIDTPIVANSRLVESALIEHFDLDPERVLVHYPGFDSRRFRSEALRSADGAEPGAAVGSLRHRSRAALGSLRQRSRAALALAGDLPLIGLVTSGELDKRGLDVFLQAATQISERRRDARFLVVGAKRLPSWAARHPLVSSGRLLYRPKGTQPERWFAALDLFLFPARFEEFGMVVSEAQACGVPVLTSRRVGASECLPPEYGPWLIDAPDADAFATNTLALLDDDAALKSLSAAGIASITKFDDASYVRQAVDTIRRCATDKASRPGAGTGAPAADAMDQSGPERAGLRSDG